MDGGQCGKGAFSRAMNRQRYRQRGESFIETIAAMLIISLGMLMLAGSIVTSARVNHRADNVTIQVVPPPLPSDESGWSRDPTDDTKWVSSDGRWEKSTDWFVKIGDGGDTLNITLYTAIPEGGERDGKQVLYYYAAS